MTVLSRTGPVRKPAIDGHIVSMAQAVKFIARIMTDSIYCRGATRSGKRACGHPLAGRNRRAHANNLRRVSRYDC